MGLVPSVELTRKAAWMERAFKFVGQRNVPWALLTAVEPPVAKVLTDCREETQKSLHHCRWLCDWFEGTFAVHSPQDSQIRCILLKTCLAPGIYTLISLDYSSYLCQIITFIKSLISSRSWASRPLGISEDQCGSPHIVVQGLI